MSFIITDLSVKRAKEKRSADKISAHRRTSKVGDKNWKPGLREWHHKGGKAAFVPDRGFTKQLKALDKELEVVWNSKAGKWEIWRFPAEGKTPFHCMTVQTDSRSYREIGADVLIKLQAGDPWRYGAKELGDYFDELDRQLQRRKERAFKNMIESITKETFNYARGVLSVQVPLVGMDKASSKRRAICG